MKMKTKMKTQLKGIKGTESRVEEWMDIFLFFYLSLS